MDRAHRTRLAGNIWIAPERQPYLRTSAAGTVRPAACVLPWRPMPLARPACEPQLFSESAGPSDQEFARVLRTADPGPALDGPVTFLPAVVWLAAWQQWREQILVQHLAPTLLQIAPFAVRGCAREILALDRTLDSSLSADACARSREAGRRLLARLASSRGDRCLGKFQQWVAADEMPAHFPTVYATQHALFHLPLRLLVPAYAYWEWSAAGGDAPAFAREADALCRLAQDLLPALSPVHAAVANDH